MIQRFEPCYSALYMAKVDDGTYVRHTDHEAAIAAKDAECLDLYRLNEKLTAERDRLREAVKTIATTTGYPDNLDGDPCQCTACQFSRIAKAALAEGGGG